MEPQVRKLNPSPQLDTNIFSRLVFWWTHHVFRLGYHNHLEDTDIYDVLPEDSSVKLSNDLGREWEKETYRWKTGGKPSLFRALFRCYGPSIIGIGFIFLLEEVFRVGQAVFLGLLVAYFEPGSKVTWLEAYLYALGWSLTYIFVVVLDNFAFHKSFYFGLKMRVGCTSLIYRKLMRLSQHALYETNVGHILNLISADAQRFEQSCLGINYLWIGPLETVVVLVLLWKQLSLGPFSLIGVGVIAILVPLQLVMGRYLSRIRVQLGQLVERRVNIMSEIIAGIRTIKVHVWEKAFTTLVTTVRSSEWMYLRALSHCRSLSNAVYLISGKVVMLGTFVTLVLVGGPLRTAPSVIFPALALYEVLRASLGLLLPWGIQYFRTALDTVRRMQAFLLLEERNILESHLQMFLGRPPLPEGVVIKLEDYTSSWARDTAAFKIDAINISVQQARMVVLVGQPGSGRSSLLMAILGELPRLGGFLRTKGKMAYVPQHPWLFRGTIRDNILFGHNLDNRRYNRVLHACGLLPDLESLTQGDLTLIGDRGVALNNGQKARLCLARAAYHDTDIYLIDDIFSVVEDRAAIHIFTKCFCGLLNTKTIIYVTSNLNLIRAADHIVILKQGKVQNQGTWEDLKNIGVDFREVTGVFESGEPEPDSDQKIEDGLYKNQLSLTVRRRASSDSTSTESLDSIVVDFKDHPLGELRDDDAGEKEAASCSVYWKYLRTGGGLCGSVLFVIFCVFVQITYVLSDWWLYYWAIHQWPPPRTNVTMTTRSPGTASWVLQPTIPSDLTNISSSDVATTSVLPPGANNIDLLTPSGSEPLTQRIAPLHPHFHLYIYLGLFVSFVMMVLFRASLFSIMAVKASLQFHTKMFKALLRTPLSFFEKFTAGRMLTRFARDIMIVDDPLPASLFDCIQFLSLVLGAIIMMGAANPWLFLILLPLGALFAYLRRYYISTSRQVKNIEVAARSPIYRHLAHTLDGLWTIRAFQGEERFIRHFDVFMDRHTASAYLYLAVSRWFAIRLDLLGALLVCLLAFISVLVKDIVDAGVLGLAMAYAVSLMGLFQYSVRQMAEVDTQMASVERIEELCDAKPEGEPVTGVRPQPQWPQYGIVTFEGVSVSPAGGSDTRRVLRNMWCCIRAEEKVGVLGGSEGYQEALLSAVLRLVEPSGIVRIDGIDVSEMGLHDLRDNITVIQQDPMMFGGSIRRNLDPFTTYPDALLWKALEAVCLKTKVEKLAGKMYAELAEFGTSFSLGERQLLSMARALLKNSKIVFFEETASLMDRRTEALIQYVLQHKFPKKTVVVLGRRPESVISMDRVMMLDEGRVKEFDSAHTLLQDKSGMFSRLVHSLPDSDVRRLEKLAQDKHENKPYEPPPAYLDVEGHGPGPGGGGQQNFLPSFQTNRLSGVLSHFTGNRFSTNRF